METAPSAFLFDLDGLLLDTEPIHGLAWSTAARHYGAELTERQLLSLRGRRRQDCAEQVDRWLPKSVGTEALLRIQQPCARALLPQAAPMPGAQALVRYGLTNGIRIDTRIYGDDPDVQRGKPDAQPFLVAADRLGCQPTTCWAFEDSEAGTTAALAAGCLVWVLDTAGPDRSEGNPRHVSTLKTVLDHLINKAG